MITIHLHDLLFNAFHGIHEEERRLGNEYVVDASLEFHETIEVITHINETINYVTNYNQYDLYLLLGDTYEKINNIKLAEQNYLFASYMIPNRFIPKYHLVRIYIKEGQNEMSKKIANEIINMPVKVSSKQVDFIKREMMKMR